MLHTVGLQLMIHFIICRLIMVYKMLEKISSDVLFIQIMSLRPKDIQFTMMYDKEKQEKKHLTS